MTRGRTPAARALSLLLDETPPGPIGGRALATAGIGVSGPILLGVATGHLSLGLTVGLGALFLSGGGDPAGTGRWRSAAVGAALALLAVAAALLTVQGPAPELTMVGLAFVAAMVSGYSRAVGAVAIRAIIYLVLCVTLLEGAGAHRPVVAAVFVAGAGWNILVRTIMAGRAAPEAAEAGRCRPTQRQLWNNWRRGLTTWSGWQFPVRLTAGLAAACGLRDLWPEHHFGWIVLTTALLTQRPLEAFPLRLLQRTVGTAAGVGLAWLLLSDRLAPAMATALIAGLASLASLARMRSYLLYAALSTPVILLVMDFGRAVDPKLLADRLIATGVGAGLVLVGNLLSSRLSPSAAT